MSTPPVYPAGTTINDRYELHRKLGSDGAVYEAHDRHLDKMVALKLLHPKIPGVAQPWAEAQRLEQLKSVFLLDVINADVVTSSDIRYIVTPLLDGGDLERNAAPLGLSVHEAVRYLQQIAAGIGRIHAAGMVHRDVKPANALIAGDRVIVSDLEFCELLDGDGRADRNGSFCTAAPETADSNGFCSVASDIYSLGATVFYLMSGEYPVDHRLPKAEQQSKIVAGEIRDIRSIAPHISQSVGTVVRRALNLDPAKRFATAEEFGNALVRAARGSRNWRKIDHQAHVYCASGEAHDGRAAVDICAIPAGKNFLIAIRTSSSGRRVKGILDMNVARSQIAKAIQRLVKDAR